jgi:hypothetical protein
LIHIGEDNMSPTHESGTTRAKRWPTLILLLALPFLLLLFALFRSMHAPLPRYPHRDASLPSGHDPAIHVPQYSNIVFQLQKSEFLPIDGLTMEGLKELSGSKLLELTSEQSESLFASLFQLIRAHSTADAGLLYGVMIPAGNEEGLGWNRYGERRLQIILAAGGLKDRETRTLLQQPSWKVIQQAWSMMVAEYGLTNWWDAISPEGVGFWVHSGLAENIPPLTSELYGEMAGTVIGPSFLNYEGAFKGDESLGLDPLTIAAVRLVVRFHNREKPIIYLFRWRWSASGQMWYPFDRCIGVVGARPPDPFF